MGMAITIVTQNAIIKNMILKTLSTYLLYIRILNLNVTKSTSTKAIIVMTMTYIKQDLMGVGKVPTPNARDTSKYFSLMCSVGGKKCLIKDTESEKPHSTAIYIVLIKE